MISGAAAVLEVGSGGQIFGSCWVMRITSAYSTQDRSGIRLWLKVKALGRNSLSRKGVQIKLFLSAVGIRWLKEAGPSRAEGHVSLTARN